MSSSSVWSILDTLPCEHGAAGQTAPDGVAGDSACMDLGGSDRQECCPGMGRSWLQHLLSTGLCLGSALLSPAALSHSWGPDWTAACNIKALKGTVCRREGSSYPITYSETKYIFPSHLQRCDEKCLSCAPWPLSKLNSPSVWSSGFLYQLWTKHTTVHTDTCIIICACQNSMSCQLILSEICVPVILQAFKILEDLITISSFLPLVVSLVSK